MKKTACLVCMAAMGIAGGMALSAAGATYNASTGYVTLSNAGSGQRQSPLSTTAAIDTGNNKYFWSDQLPIHAGTNYYLNVGVRGIFMTATSPTNHYEFLGNRSVMGPSSAISWKSFSPSTYTFLNEGAIVQGGCIWKVNEAITRPVIVRGRVEVTDSASNPFKLIPWGAEQHYMEGLTLDLETEVIGDANQRMQVVANTSATFPRRGIVRLVAAPDAPERLRSVVRHAVGLPRGRRRRRGGRDRLRRLRRHPRRRSDDEELPLTLEKPCQTVYCRRKTSDDRSFGSCACFTD